MYAAGQTTPFGDVLGGSMNWTVPQLWAACKDAVNFDARTAACAAFNASNRFRKRACALAPTKYGGAASDYKVREGERYTHGGGGGGWLLFWRWWWLLLSWGGGWWWLVVVVVVVGGGGGGRWRWPPRPARPARCPPRCPCLKSAWSLFSGDAPPGPDSAMANTRPPPPPLLCRPRHFFFSIFCSSLVWQVGALVNIYSADGTVEVAHSGSELGQGINTKVAQAVAFALGCALEDVVVASNSTATIPNGGCTGGSGTSESVVAAALLACRVCAAPPPARQCPLH